MASENKAMIDQPNGAGKAKGPEPIIQVMPERYRGSALHQSPAKVVSPKEQPKPKPVPPPETKQPVVPPKKKKPETVKKPVKKKGFPVKLVVIGVIIVALFVAAAIIVLSTLRPAETTPEVVTPVEEETEEDVVVEEEEEMVPDEIEEEEEEEIESPFAEDLQPGVDSDSDGLTNVEELLYGTNPQLPDSDEDGFLDGNEVFHRYNPNGTAPGSLVESGLVRLFDEPSFSYTLTYPALWNVRAVGGPTEQVVFTASSGEIVQVLLNTKQVEQSISDWFLAQDLQASVDDLLQVTTKEGLVGIMSPDRLTAYLDAGEKVYIVSYNVGNKTTVDYLQTFQMMLNSLILR